MGELKSGIIWVFFGLFWIIIISNVIILFNRYDKISKL